MKKSEKIRKEGYSSAPNKGHLAVQIKFPGLVQKNKVKENNKKQCRKKVRYDNGL